MYIKFPFGVLDFNGLKDLQQYHQHLTIKINKMWLSECDRISGDMGINITKINLSSDKCPSLDNLIGNQWVTEKEINILFSILNRDYNEVLCLLCTPDKFITEALKMKSQNKGQIKEF